jgi:hypothetical protein
VFTVFDVFDYRSLLPGGKAFRHMCGVLVALLLGCVSVLAQSDNGRIQGTVTDATGAALAGATVTATNTGTGRASTAQTNESGEYTISALQPGSYRIEVKQDGFKGVAREVTLEVTQTAVLSFALETGSVTDVVEVSSDVPLVQSTTSNIGEVIQGRQIIELPLNGRNFTQLATLIPGVTRGIPDGAATGAGGNAETFRNGNNGGAAISVNGLREQANNFLLDGVDNNESLVNTIAIFPPTEAIQEFRVQTSVAPAEFGRAGGALVNATIRSGSNEYHGSAFNFLRNSEFDARDTFAPRKQLFRRNEFGGTLGGPIIKNKLFAFGDYQGLRQFQPQGVDVATVPTALMRQGNFSELLNPALNGGNVTIIRDPLTGNPFPGNIIPANRINPVAQRYLNAFPLPNNGNQILNNYVNTRNQIQDFNAFDIRVDYNLSERDQIFGRFSFGNSTSQTTERLVGLPSGFGSGSNFAETRGAAIGETHTFSPSVINEFRFGFTRINFGFQPPFGDQPLSANLGIPNANTSPLLGGGALIGGANNQIEFTGDFGPFLVPQNTFSFSNTLSIVKGNHNFKFGGNVIRRQVNLFRPTAGKGFFFYNGTNRPTGTGYDVAEMLVGFADFYQVGPPFGTVGTRNFESGFFAQDDWRITRKLTLNYGIRYDLYTFPTEVNNRQANFDIVNRRLLVAGQDGNSESLIPTDKNNFAPRVGFAYDVFGTSKLVLRGGYGLFYFLDRGGIDNQLAQNLPFSGASQFNFTDGFRIGLSGQAPLNSLDSRNSTGALPVGSNTNINLNNPQNINAFAALPTNVNSYVQQFNLQAQYQLTNDTAVSLSYVGAQGKKLVSYYNLNQQAFGTGARRFQNLGNVTVQETRGNSIYHGMQMQVERRLTKGWQYLASYTWSHTIDDSTGAFGGARPQDITNFRLERGNSDQDFRHNFVFSTLYELPFGKGRAFASNLPKALDLIVGGFQVNSIVFLQSGQVFSAFANGADNLRADLVGDPDATIDRGRFFNTSAFATVPRANNGNGIALRPGTSGRNILRGPARKQIDLSILKNFNVTDVIKVRFGADLFNLTNTAQLANPQNNVSNGDFGNIVNSRFRSSRQAQFSLRVSF